MATPVSGQLDATGKAALSLDLTQGVDWVVSVQPPAGYAAPTPQDTGVLADGASVSETFQLAGGKAVVTVTVLLPDGHTPAPAGTIVTATPK